MQFDSEYTRKLEEIIANKLYPAYMAYHVSNSQEPPEIDDELVAILVSKPKASKICSLLKKNARN